MKRALVKNLQGKSSEKTSALRAACRRTCLQRTIVSCQIVLGCLTAGFNADANAQSVYSFENIGEPLPVNSIPIIMVTDGVTPMAWAFVKSPGSQRLNTVVGVEINSGKSVKLDFEKYGKNRIRMHLANEKYIYMYTGEPAHFLKYDLLQNRLIDLGRVADDGWLAHSHSVGPDGKMWVGAYPNTELCWIDPQTDKMGRFGPVSEDPRQQYIRRVEVSDDNTVYCAIGLHHSEIWAINANTGQKQQILPDELAGQHGYASLTLAEDGHVYGHKDNRIWRCRPDGVDFVEELPARRKTPDLRLHRGERFMSLNADGKLVAQTVTGQKERLIATDFVMPGRRIFNLGPIIDGKLYGGGFKDAALFNYDVSADVLNDLDVLGGGKVQIYDIIEHPKGIFFTSYSKGVIELYDPVSGKVTPVAQLDNEEYQQERLTQLCLGFDDRIYTGTVPVKGRLGGALVRLDPSDLSINVWRNVVHEQSLISVVGVPATKEVFFTSSVRGGSSAVPTQKEAVVGFWDIKGEKVAWQGKPVPGTAHYGPAALGGDGMIYGVAEGKYYVVDPASRKIVKVAELPVKELRQFALTSATSGDDNRIYGLGDDALFAIDLITREAQVLARHHSIKAAHGISVAENGDVYYGSGTYLWRARAVPEKNSNVNLSTQTEER